MMTLVCQAAGEATCTVSCKRYRGGAKECGSIPSVSLSRGGRPVPPVIRGVGSVPTLTWPRSPRSECVVEPVFGDAAPLVEERLRVEPHGQAEVVEVPKMVDMLKDAELTLVDDDTPARVVMGFDGSRSGESLIALTRDGMFVAPKNDLTGFLDSMTSTARKMAELYERPTFHNTPIGVDATDDEGTPVYWSDIVDGNIDPADVAVHR